MKKENNYRKYSFLLPLGIVILLPLFNIVFIHKGNYIDIAFLFIVLFAYVGMVISIILGYKKQSKNE